MSLLEKIMETEEVRDVIEESEDLIAEAESVVQTFPEMLKKFILDHPEEFIGENIEETKKNIIVFTEMATQSYLYNVCDVISDVAIERIEEAEQNDPINRYL